MSTEIQELPEVGEIVIATITKIMDHGVYVNLDEYDGAQGFLHISEVAPGWIRNVGKFVRTGEKKVLLVKKVNPTRSEIDLSLKQVSRDQRKKKLLQVKRTEKGKTLLDNVKTKANLSSKEINDLEEELYNKFDSVYDAFSDIAIKGILVLNDLKLSKKTLLAIEEISSKIKIPHVEIRGMLEITNPRSTGLDIIKKTLLDVSKEDENTNIKISYIGAPKYRLHISAQTFKEAEKALKPTLSKIQGAIEKKDGTFKFTREESKKSRV